MQILGILVMIVGIALVLVGKNLSRHLPPDYQQEDDGFLELLQSFGSLISGAGVVFLVAGMVCIVIGVM